MDNTGYTTSKAPAPTDIDAVLAGIRSKGYTSYGFGRSIARCVLEELYKCDTLTDVVTVLVRNGYDPNEALIFN
jgi:hypothetical protein